MYFDYDSDQNAQRALDNFAIENLFSAHCYCKRAGKRQYELDNYWATRSDIAYSEGTGCYSKRKAVYDYYAAYEKAMDEEKLRLLKRNFPQYADDFTSGAGDYELQLSGSSFIEVAKDGQTAKGLWYNIEISAEPDEYGHLNGVFSTKRTAVEFVKENGEWKIWHYRISPDVTAMIPEGILESGLNAKPKTQENSPEPNLKLRPLEKEGFLSTPDFAPELPGEYEEWSLTDSFITPEEKSDYLYPQKAGCAPKLDNTDVDARYAASYVEALNIAFVHGYGYAAQQMVMELDRFWAQRSEDLSYCHTDRGQMGHSRLYLYYARGNLGMNWGKVKFMHDLYPDKVELHPFNLGIGEYVMRFYASPYVIVAEDGKTAQSVVYSFGISSEIDKDAMPVPFMQLGKEVADLVLEGDTWRLLHFRLTPDIDYLLDGHMFLAEGLENGRKRTADVEKPEPNLRLRPFNMDEPYSPLRVSDYSPEPPFPYDSWDNRASWVLPEEPAQ